MTAEAARASYVEVISKYHDTFVTSTKMTIPQLLSFVSQVGIGPESSLPLKNILYKLSK
jgi:hypothetical protein